MNTHKQDFQNMVKKNKMTILDTLEGCEFKKGDIVTFTNEFGVSFQDREILGFTEPNEYGRCVYLDNSSYWFPVKLKELKKQ